MRYLIWTAGALLTGVLLLTAANPATGHAANGRVEVSALFMDAVAVKQATGSDYGNAYTVIEVTITPKDKPIDVQPEDFLLRLSSEADSSGPMAASQVLGAGGGLVVHREQENVIGVTGTNPANVGISVGDGGAYVPPARIAVLQSRMLQAKTTASPVSGLLFFPFAKKKPKDLDLVYSTPGGKLHISFK